MEYLKKVEEEKYLYSHENPDGTQTYFVRKVENGKDTTECLNTNRIGTARKLRDGWVHGRTSKKLGIIEKVEEKGPVLITTLSWTTYEKAGYPTTKETRKNQETTSPQNWLPLSHCEDSGMARKWVRSRKTTGTIIATGGE